MCIQPITGHYYSVGQTRLLQGLINMERYQARKWMLAATATAATLAILGGLTWAIVAITHTDPPTAKIAAEQKPLEIEEYLRSDEFASLEEKDKVLYVKHMLEDESNDEKYLFMKQDEARTEQEEKYDKEVLEPVFKKAFFMILDDYSKMSPDEKIDFIDDMFARLERLDKKSKKMQKEGKLPKDKKNKGQKGKKEKDDPKDFKKFMDDIEPKQRAQLMAFIMDVVRRGKEHEQNKKQGN